MEAYQTANKKYKYNQIINNKSLDEWVQNLHKYNCEYNNWKFTLLKKGSYGYDNLCIAIGYVIDNIKNDLILSDIAELIHEAWCINYIYWRDNKLDNSYILPFNKLGDDRRNMCAITKYDDLSQEEQIKDIILAKFIVDNIL